MNLSEGINRRSIARGEVEMTDFEGELRKGGKVYLELGFGALREIKDEDDEVATVAAKLLGCV